MRPLANNDLALIKHFVLKDDFSTYDPYDVWKTTFGRYAKFGYYKNKYVFLPIVGILSVIDLLNSRRFFYKKQEYPIVRSLVVQILFNLEKISSGENISTLIKHNLEWLAQNSITTENGVGWGINFPLPVSKEVYYDSKMAYSTVTPYAFESFILYNNILKNNEYNSLISKIGDYFNENLKVIKEDGESLILSYGTISDRIVTNANSYSLYALALCYKNNLSNPIHIKNKIEKLYNFIKSVQNPDGSWLYSPYDEHSFIDCFHTCFILKNLIKTKQNTDFDLEDIDLVIKRGYDYLLSNFKTDNGLFKRFSQSNKPSLVKYDLYDNAEIINLAVLLNDFSTAKSTISAVNKFFVKGDSIYNKIDIFGTRRQKNTLRWAVIPYLYALSSYYASQD